MSRIPVIGKVLLASALIFIIACLFLKFADNSRDQMTNLNNQLATLTSALEQLDDLEARYQKRITQLEEAKINLEAAPDDQKLKSKLERAQGEYDKALNKRDQQKAKVDKMPSLDSLNKDILDLKESRAGRQLLSNLAMALALVSLAIACALSIRKFDLPVILSTSGLCIGALVIIYGKHLNNLAPVLQVGEVAPGAMFITVGLIILALAYICYWLFLTKAKIDLKSIVGLLLTLGGAGLFIAGFVINNQPDTLSKYINSMSPGFLYIFSGIILFLLGSVVLIFPLWRDRKSVV